MASSPGPAATGAAKLNPRMVAAKIALNARDMTVAYSSDQRRRISGPELAIQRWIRSDISTPTTRLRGATRETVPPRAFQPRPRLPMYTPHHACPSAYSSDLPTGFIAPCLPTKTDKLPSGGQWLHEIKHDGFRIIARKDGERVRLYSRPGNDLTRRFPLIVETLARSRSCIIDGEAVACGENGIASFDLIWHHHANDSVFLCLRLDDIANS